MIFEGNVKINVSKKYDLVISMSDCGDEVEIIDFECQPNTNWIKHTEPYILYNSILYNRLQKLHDFQTNRIDLSFRVVSYD